MFFNTRVFVLIPLLVSSCWGVAQNKVSNQTGNWSNAAIWTPTGVPTTTDNVTISNTHTVSIDASGTCSNLTVGGGGVAAVLRFSGAGAKTVLVGGNLTVNAVSVFSILANSNATHSITLSGDLLNDGTFAMFQDNNSICNVNFIKNGNQTVSGSGTLTRFNRINLNMGTSANNVLDVTATSFTCSSNFLILTNGTFKLSSSGSNTLVPFTAATTIGNSSALWLNSSTSALSCSAGITLSGLLQVSSGTLFIGNANNEDLTSGGGTLSISGGSLVIAGKYNASTAATVFNMSGGILRISNNASTNTSIAPFHMSVTGSVFNMSGGTILLRREGGGGGQDLGYVNTGSSSGAVTGGTLQLGDATSPAAQNIRINSTYSVPSIVVSSASVNAILNTNSLSVTNHISIVSGTLSSNNLNIALGGDWSSAGTFSPGTANVIFTSTSAQTISKTGGETFNAVVFSGSGIKTFSTDITCNSNFSINTGASVDVSSSNYSLTLKGHFINSGIFTQQKGTVILNGAASQSIAGTSATTFNNLSLNNASGAILGNALNLEGTLSLTSGTLNVNSQSLTVISNSSVTGRIGTISGSGDISGNIIIQRFVPGGSTGWALLGSPISSALSLNDWDDDLFISCPNCPDGTAAGFSSIYTYNETLAGAYDAASSYIPLSGINDAITAGKGYWVYTGTGASNTSDITLDLTGAPRKFNYTVPLTYSNFGSSADDGWNLICNPYPSAISWAALKGTTSTIDNAIYVYNADLNSGAGAFASYVNGISSPAIGAGGIDDNIPMGQGFYVHSTGATSLAATETIKVNTNPTFLKGATLPSLPLLRLHLKNSTGILDETVMYVEQNASKNFESGFDAYKMASSDPNAPAIALHFGGNNFQINAVAPISGTFSLPLKVTTGSSSPYSLSASNFSSFPYGTCIELYDSWTAQSTNLKNSDYSFYLPDTTTAPRFELHISLSNLNAITQLQQPSCAQINAGKITGIGLNQGPWNYLWKLNGQTIQSTLNHTGTDTLKNLSSGMVELEMNTVGQCDNYSAAFFVVEQHSVNAHFTSSDTLIMPNNALQLTNLSNNAVAYFWDSGQNTNSNLSNPVFYYNGPGTYEIKLFSSSSTGCVDSVSKQIVVLAEPTSLLKNKASDEIIVKTIANSVYEIQTSNENPALGYDLLNGFSVVLHTEELLLGKSSNVNINLNSYPDGIYYLRIRQKNNTTLLKLVAF